ncbi:Cd83 Antigen [Manis pentadactyla]|nr:Cd83 Antigen [Manis pentadactyla]
MPRGLQLLLLSCACSLAPATREVEVACSGDVELPCPASWDPQVSYTVSWAKLTEAGEERIRVRQQGGHYPQKEHRRSVEAAAGMLYSLKIQNATSCSSGTYRCTLEGPGGRRIPSGTVILKVTGCPKERREDTFKKYRAEIVLLLALVVFYSTLIIFTCKFARQQTIFPDFSKPAMERAFLPVTSPHKQLEPVALRETEAA